MTRHVMIEVRDVGLEFPRRMPRGPDEPPTAIERFLRRPSYRTFTALDGVSFDVRQGEVVGIVGHNGAGKSTLLRVMAGIYRPDRGSVRVGGHVSLLAGVGVGFNVNLSGRENVYLYGSILGKPRAEMDAAMDAIVEFAELQEFIEEPVKTYSSGMRARLGFSVATQICPEILLVDEVLAVGDVRFKERSMQRIKDMVAAAGTVVVASHSFPTVREVCTRVLFFERGRMIMEGEPDAVIDRYVREQHAGAPRSASGA